MMETCLPKRKIFEWSVDDYIRKKCESEQFIMYSTRCMYVYSYVMNERTKSETDDHINKRMYKIKIIKSVVSNAMAMTIAPS